MQQQIYLRALHDVLIRALLWNTGKNSIFNADKVSCQMAFEVHPCKISETIGWSRSVKRLFQASELAHVKFCRAFEVT